MIEKTRMRKGRTAEVITPQNFSTTWDHQVSSRLKLLYCAPARQFYALSQ